jgi:ligand-binding sensor domain-containing protein
MKREQPDQQLTIKAKRKLARIAEQARVENLPNIKGALFKLDGVRAMGINKEARLGISRGKSKRASDTIKK